MGWPFNYTLESIVVMVFLAVIFLAWVVPDGRKDAKKARRRRP